MCACMCVCVIMKKVLAKGNEYIKTEYARLGRILGENLRKIEEPGMHVVLTRIWGLDTP